MKRLLKCFLLIAIVVVALIIVWLMLPGDTLTLTQIYRLDDGTKFELSDFYKTDWDRVIVINTPLERTTDEFMQLYRAVENFGPIAQMGARVGDCENMALMVFCQDQQICDVEMYNYDNEFAILCARIPEENHLPTDYFAVLRGEDRFKIVHHNGYVYAVLLQAGL